MQKGLRPYKNTSSPDNPIVPTKIENEEITFSFKHLQTNDKFSIGSKDANYFIKLIERLKNLSGIYALSLIQKGNSSLRCHQIRWHETTERGFSISNSEIYNDLAYQFEISKSEHGRVHGFIIGRIFYIVWFDPFHRLYKRRV